MTHAEEFTFHGYQEIRSFFNSGSLLTRACSETSLDYTSVRRNLNGPPKNVRLIYAVVLQRWMEMWKAHEAERRELANAVPGCGDKK